MDIFDVLTTISKKLGRTVKQKFNRSELPGSG